MTQKFYLDSSALVNCYAVETGTEWVRSLCGQSDCIIAVALIGMVEVTAAVAGKLRSGRIDQATTFGQHIFQRYPSFRRTSATSK